MGNELKKVGLVFTEEGAIDFKKSLQEINLELNKNYNQFRVTQAQWDSSTSSTEKLRAQQEYLTNAYQIQEDRVKILRIQLEELENSENKNTTAINKKRNELTKAEIKLQDYNSRLKEVDAQLNDSNQKLQQYGKKISDVSEKISDVGNKASIISAGVAVGGVTLANSAMNLENAVAKYVSSTNTATDETEKYQKVLENIYNNNYGEGYEDIADSMAQVTMQLKDLNEQDLQNITEKAIALRDLFGYDVSESVRAVKAMMDNLNVSADEAFNLIAEGKKQGLDFSNELLDNINEYSVQFAKLGLSAEDMFNIFKVGSDNGAFNLDKIGDAVKEFSIRVIDGSDTTIDGFKRIGLNADEMAKKFANGGEEAKQAFIEVVNRLGNMDDKVSQSIAGVDLFGTMWEDLGPTVITSFSEMDAGISKSSDSMQESIDQLYNTTKKKAEAQLKRLQSLGADFGEEMLPVLEDLIDMAEGFVDKLNDMSDAEKENIVKIGLFVAALGPAIKTAGTAGQVIGGVTQGIGTFTQAIGVATGKTTSSVASVNNLANVLKTVASPAGIASLAVAAAAGTIIISVQNANRETKEAFSNMGESATEFLQGISTAESHLSSFNDTLFASTEEQQRLEQEMQEIQNGITQICKTASDERRGYTDEEITQLDEYFTKLRDLKNQEIAIQSSIATAITQQATANASSFQGSLEEYKVQSQEWINTAIEQRDATLQLIQDGTTQEIALLNQKYGNQATMQNEAYATEYNNIIAQQQQKIDAANQEVAQVSQAYANGYLERASQNDGFYVLMQEYNQKLEAETTRHNSAIEGIENNALLTQANKNSSKYQEEYRHKEEMKDIWNEMYKNMSEEQENELGVWLAQVAQTEMYGGQIDEKTRELVDSILDSYEDMPDGTRDAMKNAMTPMLDEMENSEPSLFAKAKSIGDGIVSRLMKAFDEHSPSRKTRKIMKFAMQPMEEEMEEGKKELFKKSEEIGKGVTERLNKIEGQNIETSISEEKINRNYEKNNQLNSWNQITTAFLLALDSSETIKRIENLLNRILEKNTQIVMDSGVLIGEIVEPIDQELGNRQSRRERGS